MNEQMQKEKILGYRKMGIFRPVFKIKDCILYYKDRQINWEDIKRVVVRDSLFYLFFGFFFYGSIQHSQRTILIFTSGEEIHIRCDLKQKNTKAKFRISELSDDYKWLRNWIIKHVPEEIGNG